MSKVTQQLTLQQMADRQAIIELLEARSRRDQKHRMSLEERVFEAVEETYEAREYFDSVMSDLDESCERLQKYREQLNNVRRILEKNEKNKECCNIL